MINKPEREKTSNFSISHLKSLHIFWHSQINNRRISSVSIKFIYKICLHSERNEELQRKLKLSKLPEKLMTWIGSQIGNICGQFSASFCEIKSQPRSNHFLFRSLLPLLNFFFMLTFHSTLFLSPLSFFSFSATTLPR